MTRLEWENRQTATVYFKKKLVGKIILSFYIRSIQAISFYVEVDEDSYANLRQFDITHVWGVCLY